MRCCSKFRGATHLPRGSTSSSSSYNCCSEINFPRRSRTYYILTRLKPDAITTSLVADAAQKHMGVLYATAVLGAAAFVLPWLWDNVVVVGRRLWATKDLPEPPGSLWLGHIPAFLQSKCRSFRCLHAWGLKWPVYRIRFFFRPVSQARPLSSCLAKCACRCFYDGLTERPISCAVHGRCTLHTLNVGTG